GGRHLLQRHRDDPGQDPLRPRQRPRRPHDLGTGAGHDGRFLPPARHPDGVKRQEAGRVRANKISNPKRKRTTMLHPQQIEFFHQNGCAVLDDLLSAAELAEAREQMHALLHDPDHARPRVVFSYEPPEEAAQHPLDPDTPRRVWMIFDTPLAGDWWYDNIRD